MRLSRLPVMKPTLPPPSAFLPRFEDVHASGLYSNFGPQVTELEERFAKRFNVAPDRVTVLANATLALAGLVALLGPKKNWAVASWTFSATAQAILQGAGQPSFRDVDLSTHRIPDSSWQNERFSIVTLPFGTGVPNRWLEDQHLPLVVDAAASMGSVGDLSRLAGCSSVVFSLHATKYLGAGEGAVIVSGSEGVIGELKSWSNFGFSVNRESQMVGTNAKMSEYQAAIAHCALDAGEKTRATWEKLRRSASEVSDALGIDIPYLSSHSVGPYWIVQFNSRADRDRAEKKLEASEIETRRWWSSGCHKMPAFSSFAEESSLPSTENLADRTLGLPYFLGMTEADFARVHDALEH